MSVLPLASEVASVSSGAPFIEARRGGERVFWLKKMEGRDVVFMVGIFVSNLTSEEILISPEE